MTARFLAHVAFIALLAVVLAVPLSQGAHGEALHVTGVSASSEFPVDGQDFVVTFDVTTDAGTPDIDQITISTPAVGGTDEIAIDSAAASGWTAGTATDSESPSDGNPDTIVLSGGTLSASTALTISLTIDAVGADAGDQVTIDVEGEEASSSTTHSHAFILTAATPSFSVSPGTLQVAEPDGSDTFTVVLDVRPADDVVLAVASGDTDVATVDPASLTFTTANWNTPQTVTVTAADDDVDDDAGRSVDITASVSAGSTSDEYDNAADQSVSVTVTDDDTAGIVIGHSGTDTVSFEGSTADTFTVSLATLPQENTNIVLSASPSSEVSFSATTLTFTPSNGMTDQTVTLTAVDDTNADDLTTAVTITAAVESGSGATVSPEYEGVDSETLAATVVDDEGVGITIAQSDGDTSVTEAAGGRTDSFSVALDEKPYATVVLSVTTASTDITVSPATLTFTTTNFATAQTVTVTAVDDSTVEATETPAVVVSVVDASSSDEYDPLADESVTVTVTDDDAAGFSITKPSGGDRVDETGDTYTFQLALNRQPGSNVVVDIGSDDTGEVKVNTPISARLTFTAANWDSKQSVTLAGVDDALFDGPQDATIRLEVVDASSDDNWDGLVDTSLVITNHDDEKTVYATPTTFDVDEGDEGTYDIALAVAPSSDVTVAITPPSGIEVDADELVFTTADWDDAQTVTFTAVDDSVARGNRTLTIEHSIDSLDTDYEEGPAPEVTVTVADDDSLDIASVNRALQRTLDVERDGDDNILTWSVAALSEEPDGIQVWRATSPYSLIATLEQGDDEYDDAEYVDDDADADALYIITAFYGDTNALGFAASGDDLTDLPGYEGESDDDLRALGVKSDASDDDELSGGAIAGIVFGILLLIAIIVVVIVVVRRKRGGEEDWEEDSWEESGEEGDDWGTVSDAQYEGDGKKEAGWDEEWDAGWEAEGGEFSKDEGPPVEEDAWADEEDDAALPGHGEEDDTAWPETGKEETVHLTCPQCDHDFSAAGVRPIKTTCPNCGVRGVLP